MKKLRKMTVLPAITVLLAVFGLTSCPKAAKSPSLGNFNIESLTVDGKDVTLTQPEEMVIKGLEFVLKADAKISSVEVKAGTETKKYPGAGKTCIGKLEHLSAGNKTLVTFTVHSDGNNDQEVIVPITWNPVTVAVTKIYVGTGKANSAANLNQTDGNCEVVSEQDNTELFVEAAEAMSEVKITVAGTEKDAEKADNEGKKFKLALTGLSSSEQAVSVTAKAPFRKDFTYAFKVKKDILNIAIKTIKVNDNEVDVAQATSAEGLTVKFNSENALKAGFAPIEVISEDALTSIDKTVPGGWLKGSYTEASPKTSFKISAMVFNTASGNPASVTVVPHTVTFTLKAANKKDTTVKLILQDENIDPKPFGLAIGEGSCVGHNWRAFNMLVPSVLTTENDKLFFFGKSARPFLYNDKSKPFVVFRKVLEAGHDSEWEETPTLRTGDNRLFGSKSVLGRTPDMSSSPTGTFEYIYTQEQADTAVCAIKGLIYAQFVGGDHGGYFKIVDDQFNAVPIAAGGHDDPKETEVDRLNAYISDQGYELTVKKSELTGAIDKLLFLYMSGEEVAKATLTKSVRDDSSGGQQFQVEGAPKTLKEPSYLFWDIYDDIETKDKILAWEASKSYKYEVELTFKDTTAFPSPVKFTAIYKVTN